MTMSADPPTFNLVHDPWINCTDINGEEQQLSLREVFEKASDISRINGDSAAQDYAVLRILLAVFWRANIQEIQSDHSKFDQLDWWLDAFDDPSGVTHVAEKYLLEWASRFNLFDTSRPFMQVAGLHTSKNEFSPIRRLVPEFESSYFTLREGEAATSLSPAEAARWLVAVHAWDYSGIKPGAVGDERVKGGKGYPIGTGWAGNTGGVVLHGSSLAQTLVLNTVPETIFGEGAVRDLPAWEQDPVSSGVRTDIAPAKDGSFPLGPCDVVTWQSRRVRLQEDDGRVTGVLITNGDKYALRNQLTDPMTGYRFSKNLSNKQNVVHIPKAHPADRTMWRGLEAVLAGHRAGRSNSTVGDILPKALTWLDDLKLREELEHDELLQVELIGMTYGTQSSTITGAIHAELPLATSVLLQRGESAARNIVTAAKQTLEVAMSLGRLQGNLFLAAGGSYEFDAAVADAFLGELEPQFLDWLATVREGEDSVAARDRWYASVESIARSSAKILIRGAGEPALLGTIDNNRIYSSASVHQWFLADIKKKLTRESENEQLLQEVERSI